MLTFPKFRWKKKIECVCVCVRMWTFVRCVREIFYHQRTTDYFKCKHRRRVLEDYNDGTAQKWRDEFSICKTWQIKELRKCILRIICMWSSLHQYGFIKVCIFYLFFWKTRFSSFCVFYVFSLFWTQCQLYKICIIIVYMLFALFL